MIPKKETALFETVSYIENFYLLFYKAATVRSTNLVKSAPVNIP